MRPRPTPQLLLPSPWLETPPGIPGVLVYLRTAQGNSALAWMDEDGHSVTESQFAVLRAAACALDTPALPRRDQHHTLVEQAVAHITQERSTIGGQLGRPSGARHRTYTRLKAYVTALQNSLLAYQAPPLLKALDELYQFPLQEGAQNSLTRQLRSHVANAALAELVVTLHEEGRLCLVQEEREDGDAHIICSMGLVDERGQD